MIGMLFFAYEGKKNKENLPVHGAILPDKVRTPRAMATTAPLKYSMDCHNTAKLAGESFCFRYDTNETIWHKPNTPNAPMCSLVCSGMKPTNEICMERMVPTQYTVV